ncbi:multiple monosaccharide ABC transporter permease [Lysinimonas soli]|uniref:Xylose transport system permease protein XylH n=1 Tax=Lysinimonas soli TaxID=1074233 RepID=A0ABW0NUE8_9MICO
MSDHDPAARTFRFTDLRKVFGAGQSSGRQFGILGALVAIIVLFQVLTGGKTLDPINLLNLVNGNAYVLILAIGMVMVIIAGHIDLSVGSVAAFVGIIVALSISSWHWPWPFALLLGLGVGALVGAWQGFWVAYVGVPAFIVTLAGMLIFRGANQFVGNSTSVGLPAGNSFAFIGSGYLPDPAWGVQLNLWTVVLGGLAALAVIVREVVGRRRLGRMGAEVAPRWVSVTKVAVLVAVIAATTYLFAHGPVNTSFPIAGLILVALVIGYSFLSNRTIIGRHIYAVGGNWRAAELSGVKIRRVNFFVMMNMSIIAALAGEMWVARAAASGPGDGIGWELDAIAAVFIGGAAVSGGIGTIVGSVVGGLVIAVLNNGLALLGVSSDRVQIIKGLVLLIAVGVDVYSKRQGRPSIIGRFQRRSAMAESDDSSTADSDARR